MIPQFKNYIETETQYHYLHRTKRDRTPNNQKLLGIALVAIGVIGFISFPEDNGGFLLPVIMGIARIFA